MCLINKCQNQLINSMSAQQRRMRGAQILTPFDTRESWGIRGEKKINNKFLFGK